MSGSSGLKREQEEAAGGPIVQEMMKRAKCGCSGAGKCGCSTGEISQGGVARRKPRFNSMEEYKNWIKQGNGYAKGFKPSNLSNLRRRPNIPLERIDLPIGAPPEYHSHFADFWLRCTLQLLHTNGMDADTNPGKVDFPDVIPIDVRIPSQCTDYPLMTELVELALKEYNEESNFFKYKLMKIEKANYRITGYEEYFMTVKVSNLTLGTVVETFQIHAGRSNSNHSKEVFSCLPKGGALHSVSEME